MKLSFKSVRPARKTFPGRAPLFHLILDSNKWSYITETSKIILFWAIFLFLASKWEYFSQIIPSTTKFKLLSFEVDFDEAKREINNISISDRGILTSSSLSKTNPYTFHLGDRSDIIETFRRARIISSSLVGAKILWVDPHPENLNTERNLMERLGIRVDVSTDTTGAYKLVKNIRYDMIISNVGGGGINADPAPVIPLRNCPATYFPGLSHGDNVAQDPGPVRVETLYLEDPKWFGNIVNAEVDSIHNNSPNSGNIASNRFIFYTANHAGTMADRCVRSITNRLDVLLREIVTGLSELRSKNLREPPPPQTVSPHNTPPTS